MRNSDLNLNVLDYPGYRLSYIADIWEIVGGTLEKVASGYLLDDNTGWVQAMNQLKANCGSLSSIQFQHSNSILITEEGEAAYVDLLCSYGPELIDVELSSWLKPESLHKIIRECVNLRCTYLGDSMNCFSILETASAT